MAQHDPRRWAPDASADACLGCNAAFTVITRRHHCRSCGEIFCEPCCKQQAILPVGPGAEQQGKVRVCVSCLKVCDTALARAEKTLGANIPGPTLELVRLAAYWQTLNSDVSQVHIRRQRALTKATLLLSTDVPAIKDEIVSLMRDHSSPNTSAGGAAPAKNSSSEAADPQATTTTRSAGEAGDRRSARSPTAPGGGGSPPKQPASGDIDRHNTTAAATPFLTRITPADAMRHLFGAPSTSRLGRLEERVERLTRKAVNVHKILERHSLTTFFLHMYQHLCELFMTSFVAHVTASGGGSAAAAGKVGTPTALMEAQHGKSFRRLMLHGAEVNLAASAVLARTVLHLESLRMPSTYSAGSSSLPLSHSVVGCELLDDIAEQIAVSLTMRYHEQICSVTEEGAAVLATTAAARVHHRVHGHACSSEDDFSVLLHHVALEDYVFDAILNERPAGVPEQPLKTRLRNVDFQWTDHGALSCCGLTTPEGLYYDPVYLGAAAESNSKLHAKTAISSPKASLLGGDTREGSVGAAGGGSGGAAMRHVTSSVAAKYYYRYGTVAEAVAMKMSPTGHTRHSPSPLWSAQMLFEEYQTLCRRRDTILVAYSSVPFADTASSSWASLLGTEGSGANTAATSSAAANNNNRKSIGGGVRDSLRPGGNSAAASLVVSSSQVLSQQESISHRVVRLRNTLRRCRDFVANTESLRSILTKRYQSMFHELEVIQIAMTELQRRAEDILGTPRASAESKGLLAAIDRISQLHRTDYAPQVQQEAFHRYHKFLNVGSDAPTPATTFYLHLRTKLLMALLGASRAELQDDPVALLGNPVPYSGRVALAVDAMNAQASQSPLMKSWSLPDVVDRHVERVARVLADRFRDIVEQLTPASVIVLAECCAARMLYLFSHSEEEIEENISRTSSQLAASSPKASSDRGRGKAATGSSLRGSTTVNHQRSMKFEWLLEVSAVQHMEHVDLSDTIVGVKKIYLTTLDARGSTLSEQGIHLKAGLCAADGSWWSGTRETHGNGVIHHRGPKYGVLHAFPGEIEAKKLLPASTDWSVDIASTLKKPRRSFFRSAPQGPTIIPPLIKPRPSEADRVMHLGSSTLSVGPRLVGPSEVVGVTLFPRSKTGEIIALTTDQRALVDFIALTGSEDGRSLAPVAAPLVTPPGDGDLTQQPTDALLSNSDGTLVASPSAVVAATTSQPTAVVRGFQCSCAGVLIIAAEYKGALLIGNAVRVRPGRVDWPQHCSVSLQPSRTVVAGETVTATLTLRDEFSNVTSTTNPDDFSVVIDNNGESVVASSIVEEVEGTFKFVFVPTNEGQVSISITAAGVTMSSTAVSQAGLIPQLSQHHPASLLGIPPLRCVPGLPDFKNSMFSFDDWDVVAGTHVNGNLLLRDVYGNKVEAEDEHPLVEMVNGLTTVLPVERVHRGEYIFTFCPTRQGTAVLRATSLRSFATLIARVNVIAAPAASDTDWSHSTISCLSKVLFAGEVAEFHIVMRDSFGNSIASDVRADELECWLRYVDGEEATNADKAAITTKFSVGGDLRVEQREDGARTATVVRSTQVTGQGASFAFRVTPGAVGDVIAFTQFRGATLESGIMNVRSAPLSWPSSKVSILPTAHVGEWVPVMIQCRDRFGNPSDAQEGDFSVVAYHDPTSNQEEATTTVATVKTKPVSGAGSSFAFQVMCTKTGVLRVEVTYAGYLKHECSVLLEPLPAAWTTTELFVGAVQVPSPTSSTTDDNPTPGDSGAQPSSSAPYLRAHQASTQVVAGHLLKVGLRFRDQYGNWTSKPTAAPPLPNTAVPAPPSGEVSSPPSGPSSPRPSLLPFHISLDIEGHALPIQDYFAEATEDPDCSWCRCVYHVQPTIAGRLNVQATWIALPTFAAAPDVNSKDRLRDQKEHKETKNARATVIPNVVDWNHCTVTPVLSTKPSAAQGSGGGMSDATTTPRASSAVFAQCVVAGNTIAMRVRLFDRYSNPVEASTNMIHVSALNGTADYRNDVIELMSDVRSVAGSHHNELLVQCVAELSGTITVSVQLDPEHLRSTAHGTEEYREAEPTMLVYHVAPAPLDWLGKTHARHFPTVLPAPTRSADVAAHDPEGSEAAVTTIPELSIAPATAGAPFMVELYLRDCMNNPVFFDDWEDGQDLASAGGRPPFSLKLIEASNPTTRRPRPRQPQRSPDGDASLVLLEEQLSGDEFSRSATTALDTHPHEVHVSWRVQDKERGLLVATVTAMVAGTATLHIACEGTLRPSMTVDVVPAAASWYDSDLVWDAQSMTAGTAATCHIKWRDTLGNITTTACPPTGELVGVLHQFAKPLRPFNDTHASLVPPTIVPQGETTVEIPVMTSSAFTSHRKESSAPSSGSHNDVAALTTDGVVVASHLVVSTAIAGEAYVRLHWKRSDDGSSSTQQHPIASAAIRVLPAIVSWSRSALVLTPPPPIDAVVTNTMQAAIASHRPAGTEFAYLLILRDRFGNDSNVNINDVARDVRAQVLFGGTSIGSGAVVVTPATQVTDELGTAIVATGRESSHFVIAFTPTRCGTYHIGVGLTSESEVDDLMAQPSVGPAEVCWTQHTRLYADAEFVDAGGDVFVQLECRDRFGNPSAVGVDNVAKLAFRCVLIPPWAEASTRPAQVEDIILACNVHHVPLGNDTNSEVHEQHCTTGVTAAGGVMVLPQEVGLFGTTLSAQRTGTLHLSVFYAEDDEVAAIAVQTAAAVSCDEVITVQPSTADWERAQLVHTTIAQSSPSVDAPTVGHTLTFGLVLYDVFGNLISPALEKAPPAVSNASIAAPSRSGAAQPPRYDGVTTRAVLLGESVSAPRGNASQREHQRKEDGGRSSEDSLIGDADDDAQRQEADDHNNAGHSGAGPSASSSCTSAGRRIEEFYQQEIPQISMICENNNHNDPILLRYPEERLHTTLVPRVQVRPEWIIPASHVAAFVAGQADAHCSVFFHVVPTVAGVCQLRLVHKESESVHYAAVESISTGPIVSGELLQPVPTTVRAGDAAAYHLKLRDEFNNWIVADPTSPQPTADAAGSRQSVSLQSQLSLLVAAAGSSRPESAHHPGTTWTVGSDASSIVMQVTPTIVETLHMRVLLAGSGQRQIAVLPPLLVSAAPMHAPRCQWTLYEAPPTPQHLKRPPAPSSSVTVAAGEQLYASLAAFDRFGNVIADPLAELSIDSGGSASRSPTSTVLGINGTSRPPVTVVTTADDTQTDQPVQHQVVYTLTPSERSTVSLALTTTDATPGSTCVLSSDVIAVQPAPLHWPSCTVRLSDEHIVLGSSTNVILQLRDRFLNPVEGPSAAFRVVVVHSDTAEGGVNDHRYLVGTSPEHGDTNAACPITSSSLEHVADLPLLPDSDGFTARKGKTLLCEFKPVQRGLLYCEVYYACVTSTNENQTRPQEAPEDLPHVVVGWEAMKRTGTSKVE